jgi:outer membrane protein OmpA-like peptidoglycan-associated protein
MKTTFMIALTALALLAGVAQADERGDRWGMRGTGVGAAAGAVIAGPPGLIVGAGIGAFIGDRMGRAATASVLEGELALAQSDIDELRASLEQVRGELYAALVDLSDRDERIGELEASRRASLSLETDVMFRTGSSDLEPAADVRLDRLATALRENPDLTVRLDGHADARGEAEFNQALSEQRSTAVRDGLVERGVESTRIEVHGHGAENARGSEGDLDGHALDRRVDIRLEGKAGEARVANSD